MSAATRIAAEEWRYWRRSRLGPPAMLLTLGLIVISALITWQTTSSAREARESLQAAAEAAFVSQPDRHPHRMVHYGHYVFRTPPPLAVVDPGIDRFTGASIFLEGHRQNSATFPASYSAANAGTLAAMTPAFVYQILVPLLLLIVGYTSLAREREARTDRLLQLSGAPPNLIWRGKALALVQLAGVLLIPLALALLLPSGGQDAAAAVVLLLAYALYLLVWVCVIVAVSATAIKPSAALASLFALWFAVAIVLPRAGTVAADSLLPLPSKVQTDLEVAEALSKLGDGHNVDDPAFAALRSNLLLKYNVDDVADLPVNIRGIVAQQGEADLTEVIESYAHELAEREMQQASLARWAGVLSPTMAIRNASLALSGTDLEHRQRFLETAEAARFAFVQDLNRLHAEELSYIDDINRNSDDLEVASRARVSAENWKALSEFDMPLSTLGTRLARATPYLLMLLAWVIAAIVLGRKTVGRLERA
ncbi:MAG: DUF3526 domain-containing protein [Pseudomonadota bacterium]